MSKGQAINLFLGIWFIFGGFLQHIFLCNFLSLLLKPAFDEPIDRVDQILEKGLIPFAPPGKISYRPYFENHPSEDFQMIGQIFTTAKVGTILFINKYRSFLYNTTNLQYNRMFQTTGTWSRTKFTPKEIMYTFLLLSVF